MANAVNAKTNSSIDLESEIPFTAIVDINQAKILLDNTDLSAKFSTKRNYNVQNKPAVDFDVKLICRICLSTKNNMISFMSRSRHCVVADMFEAVTCIKVSYSKIDII